MLFRHEDLNLIESSPEYYFDQDNDYSIVRNDKLIADNNKTSTPLKPASVIQMMKKTKKPAAFAGFAIGSLISAPQCGVSDQIQKFSSTPQVSFT